MPMRQLSPSAFPNHPSPDDAPMRILHLLAVACATLTALPSIAAEKQRVYLGTYTGAKSQGIYVCDFNAETGELSQPRLAAETKSPSFLAIHPDNKHLYAVGEVGEFQGKKTGAVSAFAINADSGALTLLNQQSSGGTGPCHVSVDRTGKCVLAANYGGGSVCAIEIKGDGSLGEMAGFVQHAGASVDTGRQSQPHAHSINLSPDNKFAFAADLGLDKVLIYSLDAQKAKLTPHNPPAGVVAPGSGPRHFAFHPGGKFAYVINEMKSTLTAFNYDAAAATLTELQTLSTLPEGFTGNNSTAEVVAHPSGKFVYGSNRGHNSIAVFQVDGKTGRLTAAGHQGEGIKTPRNFNIDPSGKFLLVGSQAGDNVAVFRIDQATGALSPTGHKVEVGAPVCIKFWVSK
jgi:6-phosphogluconolactonase